MPQQMQQQSGRRMNNAPSNKPAHTVRYGSIKGTVWRNLVDNGNTPRAMYNVTFSRSYKDGEEWKDSTSFGTEDLLTVSKVASDCHTWIFEQRAREAAEER